MFLFKAEKIYTYKNSVIKKVVAINDLVQDELNSEIIGENPKKIEIKNNSEKSQRGVLPCSKDLIETLNIPLFCTLVLNKNANKHFLYFIKDNCLVNIDLLGNICDGLEMISENCVFDVSFYNKTLVIANNNKINFEHIIAFNFDLKEFTNCENLQNNEDAMMIEEKIDPLETLESENKK